MDHLASFVSFLVVIIVVYASFLSPFAAEARPNKFVDQSNKHHHVKPPRPSTTPKALPPPPPPPPPQPADCYWKPDPLPPSLPTPPAPSPSPYHNGMAPVRPSSPPQSSSDSPPPLPQSGDDLAAAPAQPPPDYPGYPDWTPPGYFPPNGRGGFLCGEGPCWDSQYCNLPCGYCSINRTCIVEPDFNYYDYYYNINTPQVPSSAPLPSPPPPLS